MNWAAVVAAVKAIAALLGFIRSEQERQAGRDEVNARDAATQAAASRKAEQIAVEGQTNEQTLDDLRRGDF